MGMHIITPKHPLSKVVARKGKWEKYAPNKRYQTDR